MNIFFTIYIILAILLVVFDAALVLRGREAATDKLAMLLIEPPQEWTFVLSKMEVFVIIFGMVAWVPFFLIGALGYVVIQTFLSLYKYYIIRRG